MDTIVRITAVAAGLLLLVAASTVAGQTTVSYRVNGPMDDPVLGAVEEIVRVRLGEIGVVVTSIERDAEKRTIRVAMDTGTRTIQAVDDRLARSGELLFAFNGRPTARLHGEIAPTYASVTCLLFNSDAGRGGAAFLRRVERRALWRTLTPLHRLRDL